MQCFTLGLGLCLDQNFEFQNKIFYPVTYANGKADYVNNDLLPARRHTLELEINACETNREDQKH